MKKFLFLFFLFGLLAPSLTAQEFTEGPFTYQVLNDGTSSTNVAIINSTFEDGADVVIPETVTFEDYVYNVTTIYNLAESRAPEFKSLRIPDGIVRISDTFMAQMTVENEILCSDENSAFTVYAGALYSKDLSILYKCPLSIESLTTPEQTKTIRSRAAVKSNVETVVLNEGLETIGDYAFQKCGNLWDINFPSSLNKLGDCAFSECNSLIVRVDVGKNLLLGRTVFVDSPIADYNVSYGNPNYSDFDGNLYSKDYTTLIAVAGNRGSIDFPEEITTISGDAFHGSCIEEIKLPESVTTLDEGAFVNSKAETIVLPVTINKIPDYCFIYCKNLRNVTIPSSVTEIGNYAFTACNALETLTLPNSIGIIPRGCFFQCNKLKSLTIPSSVTEIQDIAFSDCGNLGTMIIPKSVKKVSLSAFTYGSGNKIVFMGNDVDIIYDERRHGDINYDPIYYATMSTYIRLLFALSDEKAVVKYLPATVFGADRIFLGPNSKYNSSYPRNDSFVNVCGLQFDVTLPDGVFLSDLCFNDGTENCESEWTQLDNGDYRFMAYKTDGSDFNANSFFDISLTSDETMQAGNIVLHDIFTSVSGIEYQMDEKALYLTGYDINGIELVELEEGEVFQLPNPLSTQPEGVNYEWHVESSGVITIDDNDILHTLQVGEAEIQLIVSDPNFNDRMWQQSYPITVTPALWGDADGSKVIDLADVVAVVNHILEREVENFNSKLADVDRNGRINVVDVTQIVKLVLAQPVPDEGEGDVAGAPGLRELSFGEAQLGADGKRHISLEIETPSDYTAMQTDIELPEGYAVEAVCLGAGLGKHTLDYAAVDPQTTRLILYSASLAELPAGCKTAVVDLTLTGAGEGSIRATRALACDADGRAYSLAAAEAPLNATTGVSSAESAGMSATAVAGGMEITAPEGTAVTVSDIAGRVLLSFTADGAPAFRAFAPGVYAVSFAGNVSTATAKVLVK